MTDTPVSPDCTHTWPLLDPNEEDRRTGNTHRCLLQAGHRDGHLCACGEMDAVSQRTL